MEIDGIYIFDAKGKVLCPELFRDFWDSISPVIPFVDGKPVYEWVMHCDLIYQWESRSLIVQSAVFSEYSSGFLHKPESPTVSGIRAIADDRLPSDRIYLRRLSDGAQVACIIHIADNPVKENDTDAV